MPSKILKNLGLINFCKSKNFFLHHDTIFRGSRAGGCGSWTITPSPTISTRITPPGQFLPMTMLNFLVGKVSLGVIVVVRNFRGKLSGEKCVVTEG